MRAFGPAAPSPPLRRGGRSPRRPPRGGLTRGHGLWPSRPSGSLKRWRCCRAAQPRRAGLGASGAGLRHASGGRFARPAGTLPAPGAPSPRPPRAWASPRAPRAPPSAAKTLESLGQPTTHAGRIFGQRLRLWLGRGWQTPFPQLGATAPALGHARQGRLPRRGGAAVAHGHRPQSIPRRLNHPCGAGLTIAGGINCRQNIRGHRYAYFAPRGFTPWPADSLLAHVRPFWRGPRREESLRPTPRAVRGPCMVCGVSRSGRSPALPYPRHAPRT